MAYDSILTSANPNAGYNPVFGQPDESEDSFARLLGLLGRRRALAPTPAPITLRLRPGGVYEASPNDLYGGGLTTGRVTPLAGGRETGTARTTAPGNLLDGTENWSGLGGGAAGGNAVPRDRAMARVPRVGFPPTAPAAASGGAAPAEPAEAGRAAELRGSRPGRVARFPALTAPTRGAAANEAKLGAPAMLGGQPGKEEQKYEAMLGKGPGWSDYLLAALLPRVEDVRLAGRERALEAQGLRAQQEYATGHPEAPPLEDVVKQYSDALARGDSETAARLEPLVEQYKKATEAPRQPGTEKPWSIAYAKDGSPVGVHDPQGNFYAPDQSGKFSGQVPASAAAEFAAQAGHTKQTKEFGSVPPEAEAQFGEMPPARGVNSVGLTRSQWGARVEALKNREIAVRGESFATWMPTMLQTPDGKFVPGMLNGRTGETKLATAGAVPIPKDAAAQVNKTIAEATDSDKLYQSMLDSAPLAQRGDQQQMINLLTAHVGMTLGQIPGRRLNQEFFREAQQSSPLLQRVKARFDSRGYLTGVVLTPEQMRQMIELGKQRRLQGWQRVWDTQKTYGLNAPAMIPQDIRGTVVQGPALGAPGGGGQGAGGGVAVTDPLGGVHYFRDQASADKFKKLAGIR